jgi:hypothetical protein
MRNPIRFGAFLAVTAWFALLYGCGGKESPNPISPSNASDNSNILTQAANPEALNHYLWGYYMVRIDEKDLSTEIIPIRIAAGHMNILQFLEQSPCANCFKLKGISANPDGTLNANVSIKHPFLNKNLTGFDVRGIAMFNGSHSFPASGLVMSDRTKGEGEVVNADGFTTLYNPTTIGHGLESYMKGKLATSTAPSSTLNGFKRFVTNDPANTRNAFYAGDEIEVTYQIVMPKAPNPWVFGYAVDASWAPPINKPVDDPMTDFALSANCPEAWKIDIQDLGPVLTSLGGTKKLQIDVYDWQGKDATHPVLVECSELFDGEVQATWISDDTGFTRYEAVIGNTKLAADGVYLCLISKEANENNPSVKPWLDISAFHTFLVDVGEKPTWPVDVTPPWLNFSPEDVCADGNYAYIAGGLNGLHIFDISDPANPVWVNRVDTPGQAMAVAVSGGYAYVAYNDYPQTGLQIIDIDPPESAYIVNSVETPGDNAQAVAVSGGYAYVATGGLQIIDIDPIESAYIVKPVLTHGDASGVAVSGGYAYVACSTEYNSDLEIIDIDPPETAYIVSSVDGAAFEVAVSGGYAYVAGGNFQIIDIDPPESAYIVKSVAMPGSAYGVAVSGGYAYVADYDSGLQIIDIETPESAYIVSSVYTPGLAYEVAVSGGYSYVVDYKSALQIIDIEPPESAYIFKSVDTPDSAYGVAVSGGHAYVADIFENFSNSSKLDIVDIDPPESAYIVKSVVTNWWAYGVAVSGGYAYITSFDMTSYTGLQIIDIDPRESAYIVKSVDTPFGAQGVVVSGGYAYVVDTVSFLIIDIDPPESAYIVSSVDTLGGTLGVAGVAVSGGYAYVADYDPGLEIIDIDPPESPYIVKSVVTPFAKGVAVSGGYAYVAQNTAPGFQIIDIEPPESAYIVKSVDTPSGAQGVAVSGGYAYVADLWAGLQIIDIEPPESAYIVSSVTYDMANEWAYGVAVSGNYAYVADAGGGLRIIKLW